MPATPRLASTQGLDVVVVYSCIYCISRPSALSTLARLLRWRCDYFSNLVASLLLRFSFIFFLIFMGVGVFLQCVAIQQTQANKPALHLFQRAPDHP